MMITSCLILKPEVSTPEDRENQREDIETFFKPAIEQVGLSVLDDQVDGMVASDILDNLIQKIYETDMLIIDANCYEASGFSGLSPYLYYYVALGHSLGNRTILVTKNTTHLPHKLVEYHTLTYASTAAGTRRFITKFKAVIDEIRNQQNNKPDNPIQAYLRQKEYDETRIRIANTEEEIQKLKEQQKQGSRQSSPITFRKISKER